MLHVDEKAVRRASEKGAEESLRYLLNAMYERELIGLKLREVGGKEMKYPVCRGIWIYLN